MDWCRFCNRKGSDQFRVVHFNRTSRQFGDGVEEIVRYPAVIANQNGVFPLRVIEKNLDGLNSTGWYIYGAKDSAGMFVVQAIAPRALAPQPDGDFWQSGNAKLHQKAVLADAAAQRDKLNPFCCVPRVEIRSEVRAERPPIKTLTEAIAQWQGRSRFTSRHGGIGVIREPAAKTPIFFGHFAMG